MDANTFGCMKNTIRLRCGSYFDFRDPSPDQFNLEDIAGALSKICRFGGHCERFYSVAEHSVHCCFQAYADALPFAACFAVLMHDAAEAFCGDMVKPLKVMMPEYSIVERVVEQTIAAKFNIDFDHHRNSIREIDHAMLIAERRAMFSADDVIWAGENEVRRLSVEFQCWPPDEAERRFLEASWEFAKE